CFCVHERSSQGAPGDMRCYDKSPDTRTPRIARSFSAPSREALVRNGPSPAAIPSSLLLIFSFRVWGRLGRGEGRRKSYRCAPVARLERNTTALIIVSGVPQRPLDPLGER